jgi:diamine N-acetyltransferase
MRVTLERLEAKHAHTSHQWRNDAEVWKYTFNRPDKFITLQDELAWIQSIAKRTNEARFAILVDDVYVGNIYLTNIEKDQCFYGIFIGEKSYWGKGVGQAATLEIFRIAKEDYHLKYIFLRVKKENIGGKKLYDKLGYVLVEELGDHYLMKKHLIESFEQHG